MKNKLKIFIAAPLFNEMERERNLKIKAYLQELGYDIFLPQDEAGLSYDMIEDQATKLIIRQKIFETDVEGIKNSDLILLLLDGRTPDEGACIEMGIAWALRKPCIAYKTDNRAMDENGDNNIMIDGCLGFTKPTNNLRDLKKAILDTTAL